MRVGEEEARRYAVRTGQDENAIAANPCNIYNVTSTEFRERADVAGPVVDQHIITGDTSWAVLADFPSPNGEGHTARCYRLQASIFIRDGFGFNSADVIVQQDLCVGRNDDNGNYEFTNGVFAGGTWQPPAPPATVHLES